MPMPSGRPDNVLRAIAAHCRGDAPWPKASSGPEAHYQRLGVMLAYLAETEDGFVLTDLGKREIEQLEQEGRHAAS